MKKLFIYLLCIGVMIPLIYSCSGNLDVNPKGEKLESNFYQTPEQAEKALVAAYNPIGWQTGGTDNAYIMLIGPLNTATDVAHAGGGGPQDNPGWQAWDKYDLGSAKGPQAGYWDRNYAGINRANLLLAKIKGVKGMSKEKKQRYIAEAKFLRGYYYLWLVRLFKNVPLITKPLPSSEIYQQVQAPPDSVYAQIERDFRAAIPVLPSAPLPAGQQGRATKGAAQAFLAKALLWEVGSGNDQSKLQEAADLLEKVNTNPAYQLVKNYPDIFSPDNKFNSGSIFEIAHSAKGQVDFSIFGGGNIHGNVYTQFVGPRSYSGPKYHAGYGFNPLTKAFVDSIKGDPRYKYTVLNADSLVKNAGASYQKSYENTGFFVKKFAPLQKYAAASGAIPLNWPNDYIEVRLAGTYLLEAETLVRAGGDKSKAAHYLNAVRARVGLPPESPTLGNIHHEQFMELATEGHRWFNLVRTGRAAKVLGRLGYKKGTNEVLPIPLESLNNTKLQQNPHYN